MREGVVHHIPAARVLLHLVGLAAAILPLFSLGDGYARVAPVAIVVLWAGERYSRHMLRGIYSVFAGYSVIVHTVIVWPWTGDPPGWSLVTTFAAVTMTAFLTARARTWRRGAAAYAAVALGLDLAFLFALTVANPFVTGWSREGL